MLLVYVTRPRASQRQRRSSYPVAARRARPTRLRAREADRASIGRRAQVPRRVALPDAVPTRTPRSHSRPLDRKERSTAEALLPSNRRRTKDAGVAAQKLERVLLGAEPRRADPAGVDPTDEQDTCPTGRA